MGVGTQTHNWILWRERGGGGKREGEGRKERERENLYWKSAPGCLKPMEFHDRREEKIIVIRGNGGYQEITAHLIN